MKTSKKANRSESLHRRSPETVEGTGEMTAGRGEGEVAPAADAPEEEAGADPVDTEEGAPEAEAVALKVLREEVRNTR